LEAASRVCQKAYRVQEDGGLLESDFTPDRMELGGFEGEIPEVWGREGNTPSVPKGPIKLGANTGGTDLVGETTRYPVLWVEGLSHRWITRGRNGSGFERNTQSSTELFHDLHLTVGAGEIVALLGPSGAGKTTLLAKISGRIPVEKGKVFIQGQDITTLSKQTFYSLFMLIPQNPEHMFLAETVREELSTVQKDLAMAGAGSEMFYERIAERFGLSHRLDAHPFRLSEGEKRRLNLAVAFGVRRPLYLLDEPTYGLDEQAKNLLQKDLRSLTEGGAGVLFVTHDRVFAEVTAHTVYTLKEGQLVREERRELVCCPS